MKQILVCTYGEYCSLGLGNFRQFSSEQKFFLSLLFPPFPLNVKQGTNRGSILQLVCSAED